MKRILPLVIALALASIMQAEEPTAVLEAGYKIESEKLKQSLAEKLADPEVTNHIYGGIRKAYEFIEARRPAGKHQKWGRHEIRLLSISLSPPALRQDPNDLYRRYQSIVRFAFQETDSNGELLKGNPIKVTLPAFADPQMHWMFPDWSDAVYALTEQFNKDALETMRLERDIAQSEAETSRAKRSHP